MGVQTPTPLGLPQTQRYPFFSTNLSSPSPTTSPPIMVRWYHPPPGSFKLNFDGSCKTSSAAVSSIIRDNKDTPVSVVSYNLGNIQVFMAEAMALHKGIQEVICLNIRDLFIEGDNLLVINVVKGSRKTLGSYIVLSMISKFYFSNFRCAYSTYFQRS